MALMDKIFGEFVDVIEWTDDTQDTMVYRFERYGNEIKYGAMLTVRESQAAVLVNEGEIADVFKPGMYELRTANSAASRARSRPRSTSSTPSGSPTSNGAPRTRSSRATPSSARCACARSALT
jgi:hypothetical protein